MNKIEQIKAEIERLMDGYKPIVGGGDELTGAHIALAKLLSFLDTLESEKPMNQEGLEEEIKRYGREEMPVVLESDLNDIARHFANWQKEQMMKEAVEGVVYRYESYQRIATAIVVDINRELLGNKVNVIILPKED